MDHRVYNFAAGPSGLPVPVLEEIQKDLFNWKGMGASVMEISHRSKQFTALVEETVAMIRELYHFGDDYEVLFMQGGGHGQFAMVPLNLAGSGRGAYILNGIWSKKAFKEAEKLTGAAVACTAEKRAPRQEEINACGASYLYYCSNETVNGIQFDYVPETEAVLACDMSSDFMSRPVDVSRYGLIFAGAQKNFGPAGLTIGIVRKDLIGKARSMTPTMMDYATYAGNLSMYNTPPTFAIYVANLVSHWLLKEGGVEEMERRSIIKSSAIYNTVDSSEGFYYNDVESASRSRMNVVFNLRDKSLEEAFIREAAEENLMYLKGHRLLGGMRASLYNAVSIEACEKLADFMRRFAERHS